MTTRLQPLTRWLRLVGCAGAGFWLGLAMATAAGNQLAQDFLVRSWDVDEGLPSTCVDAVVRTSDGYVWLGTRHGLARFDGVRFVIFNWDNMPALNDNRIISLTADRQGALWIGTESGNLARYAEGKFTSVDVGNATHQSSILSLVADADGYLWLGTDGAGLIRFKNGQLENFITNGLTAPNILKLLADAQGRIWFLTAPGKLGWIEQGLCHFVEKASAPPELIHALALAQDGGLWLAAQKDGKAGTRIFKFKDGQFSEEKQTYPWPQNSWRSRPGALLEDRVGNLWLGTLGAGVFFRPAGGLWQKLVADQPFSQAEILCLVEDEGASVWMGTRTSGLHQAVPRPMSTYYLPPPNNQNVLLTVCIRQDGSIWGGTDGAGIFRWQDCATNRFGEQQGLGGLQVNALLEDSQTNFWAGTGAGLFHFRDGQFERVETIAGHASINALYEDAQGKLWAGTSGGLVCANDSRQKKMDRKNGLPSGTISAVIRDSEKRLWVAVEGQGVFRQEDDHFTRWSPRSGTAAARLRWGNGGTTRCLLADSDGSIWAATRGDGLFRLAGNEIRNWNWEQDGLPSNHQFALLADGADNLWCSSESGIFGYAKNTLLEYQTGNAPPVPWRLTQADGLPYKVCSGGGNPSATRSVDGQIWFPDGSALVVFDPISLPRHPQIWPPVIEEVRVDGRLMLAALGLPNQIMSGVRSLEIYFTSPNTQLPTRLRFRYRLEGLDKDWVSAGTRRSAQYSRVPPGNYTFQVMACDNYGVWNEQAATLPLVVVPRFWETKWFQFGVAFALLVSFGLAVRQIERARSRRKLAVLERERALERERSRIARDIHDDLGASLTEVALLGNMAGYNSDSPDELREQTQKISAAAREMTQSLEAIVWAVRPENDSLRSLVEYMNRRTDELFEKIPRQYQFIVPAELPECSIHAEVRHNVFLAYKEAITNSLKYAEASMVRVNLDCDSSKCQITIADNGRGFNVGTVRVGGTGIRNMRQRMEEIGGSLELESQTGHGTTVRLQFPLSR